MLWEGRTQLHCRFRIADDLGSWNKWTMHTSCSSIYAELRARAPPTPSAAETGPTDVKRSGMAQTSAARPKSEPHNPNLYRPKLR